MKSRTGFIGYRRRQIERHSINHLCWCGSMFRKMYDVQMPFSSIERLDKTKKEFVGIATFPYLMYYIFQNNIHLFTLYIIQG